jgi:hypothetical protein
MFQESCSFGYTEHIKIEITIFGFFYNFKSNLQVSAISHKGVKIHFAKDPLERSVGLQQRPWFAQNTSERRQALQCGPWDLRATRPGAIPATSPASSAGEWLGRG